MRDKTNKPLTKAARYFLRPIARMMIRGGVPWKEFADITKAAYVDAASADYGISGRPANASRVALLTGISRRDVARIRNAEVDGSEDPAAAPQSRISQILSHWHQDEDFTDDAGKPLDLPVEGDRSIATLFQRSAGDLPNVAILKELIRIGTVQVLDDGRYRVLSRDYVPANVDPDIIRQMSVTLYDHCDTLAWNVSPERDGPPRYERIAVNVRISQKAAEEFQQYASDRGQAYLEEMDRWLTDHETPDDGRRHRHQRVGVGVYVFQYPQREESES